VNGERWLVVSRVDGIVPGEVIGESVTTTQIGEALHSAL
jgi:hypothetical protein